jgi:transcriptional regulator with XRE-family HTH domain
MVKRKRSPLAIDARRRTQEQTAWLGGELRRSRLGRRLTQQQASERVGIARSTWSAAERGEGAGLTLETWQRMTMAVGRPLRIDLPRDALDEPADAGHLALQELVLRLARAAGYNTSFELPTKSADPRRSADVGLRDDRRRRLLLVEVWNTFGDIGAAARSTNRKGAEAAGLAAALGGERPYSVHGCWVIRATRRNRQLVARYPELFASRFPGSSEGWRRALTEGTAPPEQPGLVWADVAASRLFSWRRRPRQAPPRHRRTGPT